MDIIRALELIIDVEVVLKNMRQEAEMEFQELFRQAEQLAVKLDIEVKKPRTVGRSVFRANAGAAGQQTCEEYFRQNLFVPLVDGVLLHVQERFGPTQKKALALGILVPAYMGSFKDLCPALDLYSDFIGTIMVVQAEFTLWKRQWIPGGTEALSVKTALAALDECSKVAMPNIHLLLTILATLPVTTAEPERTFSKVNTICSATRAYMTEERLEALVMLRTHRDAIPSNDAILDRFAKVKARRLNLNLNIYDISFLTGFECTFIQSCTGFIHVHNID